MSEMPKEKDAPGKARYTVQFDEKLQIIRQEIEGELTEEDARAISAASSALVDASKDPGKVRILIKHANFIRTPSKARKIFMNDLKRSNLYRIAVVGQSPGIKAMLFFLSLATGLNKMKMFSNEREAVRWLFE